MRVEELVAELCKSGLDRIVGTGEGGAYVLFSYQFGLCWLALSNFKAVWSSGMILP